MYLSLSHKEAMRKNRKSLLLTIFTIVTLLFAAQCKKKCNDPTNSDCENYDPCYGKSETDASFTGVVRGYHKNIEIGDTVTAPNLFLFTPTQNFSSYQWKMGTDTSTWKNAQFEINVGNYFGSIPVTLIGKRTPDNNCFPDDDGIDTFTKDIFFIERKESKIFGKWQGALQSNPKDTFSINILFSDTTAYIPFYVGKGRSYMSNLPKGHEEYIEVYPQFNGLDQEEWTNINLGCNCGIGLIYGKLSDYNTIEIEFSHYNFISKLYTDQKFIGKRQ